VMVVGVARTRATALQRAGVVEREEVSWPSTTRARPCSTDMSTTTPAEPPHEARLPVGGRFPRRTAAHARS